MTLQNVPPPILVFGKPQLIKISQTMYLFCLQAYFTSCQSGRFPTKHNARHMSTSDTVYLRYFVAFHQYISMLQPCDVYIYLYFDPHHGPVTHAYPSSTTNSRSSRRVYISIFICVRARACVCFVSPPPRRSTREKYVFVYNVGTQQTAGVVVCRSEQKLIDFIEQFCALHGELYGELCSINT